MTSTRNWCLTFCSLVFLCAASLSPAQTRPDSVRPRAREAGIPLDGTPGPLNAITDVAGIEVGHVTLISGKGALEVGKGPVRTGVTVIFPRGRGGHETPVFAGTYALNGNGEMTGAIWVEESGQLHGPLAITNTHSVGVVRDAVIAWQFAHLDVRPAGERQWWSNPLIAETFDGYLNDINGLHVKREHVFEALDGARSGPVAEGSVGGGTGMRCNGYKGGIGTASRKLAASAGGYTVGVLVQCNYGVKRNFLVGGLPVAREMADENPHAAVFRDEQELGSIIVVVATDAPLMPHQLKRVARRVTLGLGRTGSTSGNGSGDIFIAFSTANATAAAADRNSSGIASPAGTAPLRPVVPLEALPNGILNPIFDATVEATEEAILNSMLAARTMVGRDDHRATELPIDELQRVLKSHNRLVPEGDRR